MSDHAVQIFHDDAELVSAVRLYLAEGLTEGASSVIIATPEHRRAFAAALRETDGAEGIQQLDAEETLARFMVGDRPDPERFDSVIGGLIRSLGGSGKPIRAYGEMVALLWRDGNVMGAIELERLWNDLGSRHGFSLFCAYPHQAMTAGEHADARNQILRLHSSVVDSRRRFTVERSFPSDRSAPRAARRFVVGALRQRGWNEGLVDGAALAVSELATNAVLHARSPFTVTLAADGNGIRLEVRDTDPLPPRQRPGDPLGENGRGLTLVEGVARRWGIQRERSGKVVWVELAQ